MKKYLYLIAAGLSFSIANSQNISDALRYSQENLNGTARFHALSGAFGALGGDFSAIQVNPAGSSVFANTQVGISLGAYNVKNKSDYFGTTTSVTNTAFDVNQAGGALVFNFNDPKTNWKKFVIAIDYENANNFDNSLFNTGVNPNHSVADYFLSYANGSGNVIPTSVLNDPNIALDYDQLQAFLGYAGGVIAGPDADNDLYTSNVPVGRYSHENYLESTGYNGKLSFNASAQYNDRFYFGLNINTHFTDYTQTTDFYEDNNNSTTSGVRSLVFSNDLHTYGTAISFQLGAIAKITPAFRVGLAYTSPTWYQLNDELYQSVQSSGIDSSTTPTTFPENFADTGVLPVAYAPYKLQTPGKFTGSLAYIFGKSGLISIDYALKDYGSTRFRPQDQYFAPRNAIMSNQLAVAGDLRVGVEKRIKQWSLRAGYHNEGSPYKDGKTIGDLNGFSAGFGYNFGYTKLDMSYSYAQRDYQYAFFSQGFTDAAAIKSVSNNVVLTLSFDL